MMNFNENISLHKYADVAERNFAGSENQLAKIEATFQTKMNGKTTGGMVKSLLGTICWLVTSCAFCWYARNHVDTTLLLICFCILMMTILALLAEKISDFSYYGKILSGKNSIVQLRNRIRVGKGLIRSNQDDLMKAGLDGWNHPLPVGTSIFQEATSIENDINRMESLKGGFINRIKDTLFFTSAVTITGIGSWLLLGTAEKIFINITSRLQGLEPGGEGSAALKVVCIIGIVIVEVGEVLLAKLAWSKTDCSVTNETLLIVPLGPVLFLALSVIASLIVMLAMWAVGIIFAIGIVCIVGAVLFATTSGG